MGAKKTDEKDYAKMMYLDGQIAQNEIARRAKCTEKTLIKWIEEGGWKSLKRSKQNTKDAQLERFWVQIENLNEHIATRPIVYNIPNALLKGTKVKDADGSERIEIPPYDPTDFPMLVGNTATSKEADVLTKLASSISKLETETSVGEIYEVAKEAIELARGESLDFAKKVTSLFDVLISTKANKQK